MQLCRKRAAAKLRPLSRNWLSSTNATCTRPRNNQITAQNSSLMGYDASQLDIALYALARDEFYSI